MSAAETTGRYDARWASTASAQLTRNPGFCISNKVNPVRPPEILCKIFRSAVGSDGIKALLQLTHVCVEWRNAALGDPSFWTTIHLSQTNVPLLDMVLARAGSQLFKVHVDHHDHDRLVKISKFVDKIEEFSYSSGIRQLPPSLRVLGPAPNLKVLHLRPESTVGPGERVPVVKLSNIFSGFFPSLRNLTLTSTVAWPTGLFSGLTSFECGASENFPISPDHVMDALRKSPKIEVLRLVGRCKPHQSPPVSLPSLRQCSLIGDGTTSLIRHLIVPASAVVFLRRPYSAGISTFPEPSDLTMASGLRVLNDVFVVSISIHDHAVRLQVSNAHGGVLDAEEHEIGDSPLHIPPIFICFLSNLLEWGRIHPGFTTTKQFTLHVERSGIWNDPTAAGCLALSHFISNLGNLKEMKICGLPFRELCFVLATLSDSRRRPTSSCKRLHVETTPIHSPRLLLKILDFYFKAKKEQGVPLQSVEVKVKCEMLIPAADHCGFLSSWERIVREGVRLEYEQATVEELPGYPALDHEDEDEDEEEDDDREEGGDHEQGGNHEEEGNYERDHEEEDEEAGTGDPDDGLVGWDGWPEQWPKTMEEMRRQ